MKIEFEIWQLITMLASFIGILLGAGKVLLGQIDRHQTERDARQEANIKTLLNQLTRQADGNAQLERDFLKFQAELPLQYVRREDYVRNQTVIEAKLDAVALRIENMNLRGNTP